MAARKLSNACGTHRKIEVYDQYTPSVTQNCSSENIIMMYERLQKCHIGISLQEHATLNTTHGRAAEGCFWETNVPRRAEAEYFMSGRGLKIRSKHGKDKGSLNLSHPACHAGFE